MPAYTKMSQANLRWCLQTAVTPFSGGATPRLGGGTTPLVGDRKVEAMLGMKREGQGRGAERMPPPAPVNVRK